MAWVTTDGNSGAYRIGGTGLAALPATKRPLSMMIDHMVSTQRAGTAGTGGAHIEWKVPIAFANQNGTYGAFVGLMQQDQTVWEGFTFRNDGNLDFSVPALGASAGFSLRAGMWIRGVLVHGNHGAAGGGQTGAIARMGHHVNHHRGSRKNGTGTLDALDRIAVGYPGNLYVRNNATGTNDTPPAGGMLVTPQPMLQHTVFARAAFWDKELPDSIMEELARGRHPLDFPRAWMPTEFYPMNDPSEAAPRCVLTGNTMTISGAFQYLTAAYLTTNSLKITQMDPPATYVPKWQKQTYAALIAAVNPVAPVVAGSGVRGNVIRSPIRSPVRSVIRSPMSRH